MMKHDTKMRNKMLAIAIVLTLLSSGYVIDSHILNKPTTHEIHAHATTSDGNHVRYTYDVDASGAELEAQTNCLKAVTYTELSDRTTWLAYENIDAIGDTVIDRCNADARISGMYVSE